MINETSKDNSWEEVQYLSIGDNEIFYAGNYWIEEFFKWLEENHKDNFFIWGHLYETHEGSENALLENGLIKEGKLRNLVIMMPRLKLRTK